MAIVVGTFDNHKNVRSLADALKSSGLDAANLLVVGSEEIPTELAAPEAEYVYLGDISRGESGGLIGGGGDRLDTGTGVPGLSDERPRGLPSAELDDYLSDLGIPDAQTDTYAEAVDRGGWIAGYKTDKGAVDSVKSAFASAGAQAVNVF